MKLAPKLTLPFALSLSFAWMQLATVARAEEHHGDERRTTSTPSTTIRTPSTTTCMKADAPCRLRGLRRPGFRPTLRASTRTGRWCARTPFA